MELEHEFIVPVPVETAWSLLLDVERVAPCMPGATLDSVDGEEFTGRMKVRLGAMTITYRGTARIVSAEESTRNVTIEASGKEARGSGTASATMHAWLQQEGDTTRVTVQSKLNVTGRPAQFGRNILSEVGAKLVDKFAKNLSAELEAGTPADEAAPAGTATAAGTATPAGTAAPAETTDAAGAAKPETTKPVEALEPAQPAEAIQAPPTVEAIRPAEPVEAIEAAKTPEQRTAAEQGTAPEQPARPDAGVSPVTPIRRRPHNVDDDDAINLLEVAGPAVAKRAAPVAAALAAILAVRYVVRRRRGKHHR